MIWRIDAGFYSVMWLKIAMLVIICCLHRRELTPRRNWRLRAWIGMIGMSLLGIVSPVRTGNTTGQFLFGVFIFSALVVALVGWLWFCFSDPMSRLLYVATVAHIVSEISSLLDTAVHHMDRLLWNEYLLERFGEAWLYLRSIGVGLMVCGCYAVLYHYTRQPREKESFPLKSMVTMLMLSLLSNIVFDMYYAAFLEDKNDIEMSLLYFITSLLTNVLLLYLISAMVRQGQTEAELKMTRYLWKQAAQRYQVSKETMDTINRKCHDLKYRLYALEKGNGETLADVAQAVEMYDQTISTGNEPIDVILSEKSLLCNSKHISLQCVVDGIHLSFMDATDLYVLFGNLLDNSITAVESLPEQERSIWIDARKHKQFFVIRVENPYQGVRVFHNGLPVTTKEDEENHGYGMKSVRLIVNKYHGELNLDTSEQVFRVAILLPIPQTI